MTDPTPIARRPLVSLGSRALAALLASAAVMAQEVRVVDLGGTGDFTEIQPAIAASSDGDTILVRTPVDPEARYAGFVIDARALTIRGEGSRPVLTGAAVVRGLGPTQGVTLVGLGLNRRTVGASMVPSSDTSGPGLAVRDCVGSVRVEDCFAEGSLGTRTWAGIEVFGSRDVALQRTVAVGARSASTERGGTGLAVVASRVASFDSEVHGGEGRPGAVTFVSEGGEGGAGAVVAGRSFLWIAGGFVEGGRGGVGQCSPYPCDDVPGTGGPGLEADAASVVVAADAEVRGGPGGLPGQNSLGISQGPSGPAAVGSMTSVSGTHVATEAPARCRAGGVARLRITGTPGELARVALARAGGLRNFGPAYGVYAVSDLVGGAFLPLGAIPPGGVLEYDLPVPTLADEGSAVFFVQVALDGAAGAFRLGGVHAVSVDGAEVPSTHAGERLYVDATAASGGGGRSWTSPLASLDDALRRVPSPEGDAPAHEVWLRRGVYSPSAQSGFRVDVPVDLRGGFDGGETSASEADPRAHPTVLDADRAGDGGGPGAVDDNAAHVVRVGSPQSSRFVDGVRLEGLTLRGARWHAPSSAGVTVYGALRVVDCVLEDNEGPRAGALHLEAGEADLVRCVVRDNRAVWSGFVGAIYAWPAASGPPTALRLHSTVVAGNEPRGVAARALAELDVRGSTFVGNGSVDFGALHAYRVDSVWVTGSVFWGNDPGGLPWGSSLDVSSQLMIYEPQLLTLQYCCFPDLGFLFRVNGNLAADPRFVDGPGADGTWGTPDDDVSLAADSPCIDAGNSLYVPAGLALDALGAPRVVDVPGVVDTGVGGPPTVDIGAVERQP